MSGWFRPRVLGLLALVILAGFGFGALAAFLTGRSSSQQTSVVSAVLPNSPTPRPMRSAAPTPKTIRTAAQTALPPAAPPTDPPATAAPATVAPATPSATATPAPTVAPPSPAHAAARNAVASRVEGSWRVIEANTSVGTIVWVGAATSTGDGVQFTLHKASVAGRAAMPCERATSLRFLVPGGGASSGLPYTETNCDGITSGGFARVTDVSPNASIRGSFWDGSRKLGDFAGSKIQ